MKKCPRCGRDYNDDSMRYCLDDGSELLYGPASADEPQTAILHETAPPHEAATRAQIHTTEQTAVLPSGVLARRERKPFDRRLFVVPLVIAVVVLGAFFGFRYLPSGGSQIDSIAVLPFVNESGNADIEYLSDGMTETLINNLSRIPKLTVKARSAVFRYKGKAVEPNQVATDLNVHAVVNGRVTQRGDNLTVNLEMVDARTGDHLWGEQYVRKVGDLIALQTDIARDVSGKLRRKLSGEGTDGDKPLPRRGTENAAAYEAYLRGRFHWNKRTLPDIEKSIEHFNRAIELDPGYALAHAGLADSYVVIPSYSINRGTDAYPKARAAALKALEIDETLAEAHATLACVLYEFDWKFDESEREFKRSIELDPNYPTAHHWYAEFLLAMGRRDEALAEIKLAQQLDPLSLIINAIVGIVHLLRGEYAEAESQLKKTIEMDPNFGRARIFLIETYEEQGRFEDAIVEYEKALRTEGEAPESIAGKVGSLREGLKREGAKGYWRAITGQAQAAHERDAESGPPLITLARMYTLAGERERAIEYIQKAYAAREPDVVRLIDPVFEPIRNDPRFVDVMQKIGLPNRTATAPRATDR